MEKLSDRKTLILEVLDTEIDKLEQKLKKVQPLLDELNQLKRTRATLLSERSVTGNISSRTRLTMEEVIQVMREADSPLMPDAIATAVGVDGTVVRSHLNRYKDTRYRRDPEGWVLIGQNGDEEDE